MEWFTLNWLMNHLEWAVAILGIGCIILFILVAIGYFFKVFNIRT